MSRIWAVARYMLAESVRTKVALLFMVIVVALLTVLPFVVAGDGLTLRSRVQSYLAYGLGSVGFLLSLMTILLSCGTLATEIRDKQVFMIASKPIPRWQFFAGKWLGICVLNAGLLAVTELVVLGFTWYLKSQPTTVPGDREALQYEVLTVRHAFQPQAPDWDALVEKRIRLLREEGRWQEMGLDAQTSRRAQILDEVKSEWRVIRPMDYEEFVFRNLLVDRSRGFLHLRFKPKHSGGVADVLFEAAWESGDVNDRNTRTEAQQGEFVVERFHEIVIPTWAVNKDGTLYVRLGNRSRVNPIEFEGADSLELLYPLGTFHWNLARALTMVWCRVAFLAALGLLTSSFLSFPVACMGCFLVLFVALISGWLGDAIEWINPNPNIGDPLWIFGALLRPAATAFVWVVPDFSKFDPVGNVVGGRLVPLIWVLHSLVILVFLKGLVLGVVGCVVLTKRELAQVVV